MLRYRMVSNENPVLKLFDYKQKQIPLHLFQCWHTLDLPEKMNENVNLLKKTNPEFVHYLFDDNMCGEFIRVHFGEELFYIFNKLKPGAYKADLWRYCVLYIHGGIYLDIKYKCVHGFKLIELTHQDYYVKDLEHGAYNQPKKAGVYQALMCSFPKNKHLLKCIQTIVYNTKHNLYNMNALDVTGPHIFDTSLLNHTALSFNGRAILYHKKEILCSYDEYRKEQNKFAKNEYYPNLWFKKNIYEYPTLEAKQNISLTRTITKPIMEKDTVFFASAPTLVEYNQQYILNLQWVNSQDIHNKTPSISLLSRCILDSSLSSIQEVFLQEQSSSVETGGLENIRLFVYQNDVYYTATYYGNTVCSIYPVVPEQLERTVIVPSDKTFHADWSYVLYKEKVRLVYQWYPLKIGEIHENRLELIDTKGMPEYFKEAHTSTSGYRIGVETWFVLHTSQQYEDNGKTYYNYQHFFAILDEELNLVRYSELFKLGGCNVESCLGLIVKEDEIILSYSVMDTQSSQSSQSFISFYDRSTVNKLKWYT